MSKITLTINVPVDITIEDDVYVAECKPLDVVSQGCTHEEATANIKDAIRLFLETCYDMGTLNEVLRDAGFRERQLIEQKTKNRETIIDVALSYFAGQSCLECHA